MENISSCAMLILTYYKKINTLKKAEVLLKDSREVGLE
jgi:hypothetical protein